MSKNTNHSIELWQRINARAFCFCVFLVAVFYISQDYYDVLGEKARIITVFSVIILFFEMILVLRTNSKKNEAKIRVNSLDISMACFGIISLVSCIFSDYKKEAFIGNSGFSVGGYIIILMTCMYFWLSRLLFKVREQNKLETEIDIYFLIILISSILQILLCIINIFGIDPLYTYDRLGASNEYLGTIGHVNNLAGYIAMVVSLASGLLLYKKNKIYSIITYLMLFLGWILVFICRSDGAIIGVVFGQLIFTLICLKDKASLKAFKNSLFIISFAALFVDALTMIVTGLIQRLDVIASVFIHNKLYLIPFVLAIIISKILKKKQSSEIEKTIILFKRIYKVIIVIGVIVAIAGIAYTFDDEWGTNRGFVWRVSTDIIRNFNLKEILIGIGPECYLFKSMELHGEEILERLPGTGLANAHCDYLNFLVTTGVLGLIAYVGIFTSIIYDYIKTNKINSEYKVAKTAIFLAIIGYIGQSWMENQMALTFAILVFFIAMYRVLSTES